ncbi:MAG: hypothetical protein AABW92_01550 [Nanoarchaeota archaeon]
MNKKPNIFLKKVWNFIWNDDSIWSWIVNIILAFVIIKFLLYPGLGLFLNTTHPVVAVVSGSMEHNGLNFDEYWQEAGQWYEENMGITKEEFKKYNYKNGFNKGDIMILRGVAPEKIAPGEVLVFWSDLNNPNSYPIIHRVTDNDIIFSEHVFQTKGDNPITNKQPIKNCNNQGCIDETNILEEQVIGKAVFRIPFLGNIKIWFVDFLRLIGLDKAIGGLFS